MNKEVSLQEKLEKFSGCKHCGLPIPQGWTEFCCEGCRQVYHIIHSLGLENFYALKERFGGEETRKAEVSDSKYVHFDQAEFQQEYCLQLPDGTVGIRFYIDAIHCAACIWLLEKMPELVSGLLECSVDFSSRVASVRIDPKFTKLSEVARKFDSIGYKPHPFKGEIPKAKRELLIRLGVAAVAAGNTMMNAIPLYEGFFSGIASSYSQYLNWWSLVIAFPAVVYSAYPFYRAAFGGLRSGVLHIDLPISLGILAGYSASVINTLRESNHVYFDSITMLIFLLLLGRLIQRRGVDRAISSTNLLYALSPTASLQVLPDGSTREVFTGSLAIGDCVRVGAGEAIPADGVVARGISSVNNSILTGESAPLKVTVGDTVFAGSENLSSEIDVEVRFDHQGSRIASVLRQVEEAGRHKPPIVQLTDRLSGYFVAVVLSLATLVALYWSFAEDIWTAFDHTLALLVVACPCALGLSAPVALAVAMRKAAGSGILFRRQDAISRLAQISKVFFDKTGTLTVGAPTVSRLFLWRGAAWQDVSEDITSVDAHKLLLALALESASSHPMARAIRRFVSAQLQDVSASYVERLVELEELAGQGMRGRLDSGETIVLGSPSFVSRLSDGRSDDELFEVSQKLGELTLTTVFLAIDGKPELAFGIGDTLREDASAEVQALAGLGLEVGMLSGDVPEVARAVAQAVGIEQVFAGLSPEEKSSHLGQGDLMVGDGINDSLALAKSGVGLCISGGAEAAMKSADIFVAHDDLSLVSRAIIGSRRAMGVIRFNLGVSLLYNACGITLAAVGMIGPLSAAVLMPLSSLSVVLSSVILKSFERKRV